MLYEVITIHFIEHMNARNNIFRSKLNIKSKSIISYKNVLLFFRRYFNPQIEKQNNKFIFHSSYYRIANNKNAINITTVHDFTYERYKHGIKKSIHSFQKFNAIRKSDFVICVSENTKKDLFHYLPEIDKKKVYVIHNGVSDEYFPNQPETKFEPYFKKNEYLLFVGKRDKYKRFDFRITSYNVCYTKLLRYLVRTHGSSFTIWMLQSEKLPPKQKPELQQKKLLQQQKKPLNKFFRDNKSPKTRNNFV